MKNFNVLLIAIACSFFACSQGQEKPKDDPGFEKRSFAEGEKVYAATCAQCHQPDGKGLNDLYPPLANSDFLLADKKRAACIIWNGIEGPITVNGKEYDMPMLPVQGMSVTKVTDVMNYIYNSFGHNEGLITEKEVKSYLESCEK